MTFESAASLAEAVATLSDPPYSEATGFSVDAQRLLDLIALQQSLLRFRVAENRYPASLRQLLTAHAPIGADGLNRTDVPLDPATRQPYEYRVIRDGAEYEISTLLSNGKRFHGFPHRTPA